MKKILAMLILVTLCTGCGLVQSYNVYKAHKNAKEEDFGTPPSAEAIKSSESRIRQSFRDPDSAIFDWKSPYRCIYPNGVDNVSFGWCIYVNINAKNGFGGYAGYNKWLTLWRNNYLVHYTYFSFEMDKVKAF